MPKGLAVPLPGVVSLKLFSRTHGYAITRCPDCGSEQNYVLSALSVNHYIYGGLSLQEAFGHLVPNAAERLLTGRCPDCAKRVVA